MKGDGGRTEAVGAKLTVIPERGGGGHPLPAQVCPFPSPSAPARVGVGVAVAAHVLQQVPQLLLLRGQHRVGLAGADHLAHFVVLPHREPQHQQVQRGGQRGHEEGGAGDVHGVDVVLGLTDVRHPNPVPVLEDDVAREVHRRKRRARQPRARPLDVRARRPRRGGHQDEQLALVVLEDHAVGNGLEHAFGGRAGLRGQEQPGVLVAVEPRGLRPVPRPEGEAEARELDDVRAAFVGGLRNDRLRPHEAVGQVVQANEDLARRAGGRGWGRGGMGGNAG